MAAIKIIARRIELQIKLANLSMERNKIEKELSKLEESCKHEIIVTAKSNSSIDKDFAREYTYCLICDEYLSPRKYLPKKDTEKLEKSVRINLSDYPKVSKLWKASHRAELASMYFELKGENPNLSDYAIGEKMKLKLAELELEIEIDETT